MNNTIIPNTDDNTNGWDTDDWEDVGPVLPRRRLAESSELDITPMIDITFLLLIFFLVASTPDMETAVALPAARHGQGVNSRTSTIITIAERGSGAPAIYLADGTIGSPLPDNPELQTEAIIEYVQKGLHQGKPSVLLKAEKGVLHRDVAQVTAAIGQVEGVELYLAVFEVE